MKQTIIIIFVILLGCKSFVKAQEEGLSSTPTVEFASVDGFLYNLYDDNHAELIGVNHVLSGDVIVPGSIEYGNNEYNVTIVKGLSAVYTYNESEGKYEDRGGLWYEEDYNLVNSITFEDGIEQILDSHWTHFCHCKIINISKTIKYISPYAYKGSTIYGYMNDSRATQIKPYVFDGAVITFRDITFNVNESNTAYTSYNGALYDKEMKTLLRCPWSMHGIFVVPEGVESIEDYAFFNCNMVTEVKLPKSVKNIKSYAFSYSLLLSKIDFSEGVERIEAYAFRNCCNLTELNLPNSLKYFDSSAIIGNGMKISSINWQKSSLETLIVNGSITGCEITISLPKSVKQILKPEGYSSTPYLFNSDCVVPETLVIPASLEICEANLIGFGGSEWNLHLSPLTKLYVLRETPLDIEENFFWI
ncbi:MAG: leucine-rich repeat domain-containing protein [Prevotella sp.]|nr:leucine-rich repeat domain-containing protein [Prevotella sp.]